MSENPVTCDRCVAPGTCCKAFPLNQNFWLGTHPDEIRRFLAEKGLPFEPLRRMDIWRGGDDEGAWLEKWFFSCPKLGPDGRCTIYEDRPNLCKIYAPGTDHMCVHVRGPDGQPLLPLREVAS